MCRCVPWLPNVRHARRKAWDSRDPKGGPAGSSRVPTIFPMELDALSFNASDPHQAPRERGQRELYAPVIPTTLNAGAARGHVLQRDWRGQFVGERPMESGSTNQGCSDHAAPAQRRKGRQARPVQEAVTRTNCCRLQVSSRGQRVRRPRPLPRHHVQRDSSRHASR